MPFIRPSLPALLVALLLAPSPLAAQAEPDSTAIGLEGLDVSVASRLTPGSAGQSVGVLTAEDLAELPVRSVSDALAWMSAVDLRPRSAAQADLSLRGGSFEQVVVLVDGRRVSDPQTGHFDLDLAVPFDDVERIEVLRGPAGAIHGADAVGGVVNVITKSGSSPARASLRVEGGSFGGATVAGGASGSVRGWTLASSVEHDRGDGHRPGVDHETSLVRAQARGPVAGGELTVGSGWAARDFGADGFYAPFPSYEETDVLTVFASWDGRIGPVEIEAGSSWRRHDDDFVLERADPSFFRNVHRSEQLVGSLALRWRPGSAWALLAGTEVGEDDLESTNLGDRRERRTALFTEAAWAGSRSLVRGGVRVETGGGFAAAAAPMLSTRLLVAPGFSLRGSLGWAHRTPTWTDRYYSDPAHVGRPDLARESAWSAELGTDASLAGAAVLSATVFRRTTVDLIDWARPVGTGSEVPWQTRNVERATFEGTELSMQGLGVGSLAVRGAVELLRVRAEDGAGFVSKTALRPLTRSVRLMAAYPLPLGGRLSGQLRHHRRTGEDAYTLGELRVSVVLADVGLFADLLNAGDASYDDVTGLPAPGRSLRVGARWSR